LLCQDAISDEKPAAVAARRQGARPPSTQKPPYHVFALLPQLPRHRPVILEGHAHRLAFRIDLARLPIFPRRALDQPHQPAGAGLRADGGEKAQRRVIEPAHEEGGVLGEIRPREAGMERHGRNTVGAVPPVELAGEQDVFKLAPAIGRRRRIAALLPVYGFIRAGPLWRQRFIVGESVDHRANCKLALHVIGWVKSPFGKQIAVEATQL
jgi:hypothetical protein